MPAPTEPARATRHTVLHGDARSLGMIPAESIELVVTSPPYPMIKMWDEMFCSLNPAIRPALDAPDPEEAFRLMHQELDRVWDEVARVLVPGGIACVNVGDATRTLGGFFRLYTNHARVLDALERRGLASLPAILWRKQTNAPNKFMGSGMLPPGAYVTLEHEHILVLRKGRARTLTAPEDRARRRRSAYFWEERNSWFSDIWELKGARQGLGEKLTRARSGAFPFELAYRLIAMHSVQGDTVLDPFLGTGTTCMAAAALARSSLGVELDESLARHARSALSSSISRLNEWTLARLARHLDFIRERRGAGKPFKHRNARHGFDVVTSQEADLELDLIWRAAPVGAEAIEVEYARATKEQA